MFTEEKDGLIRFESLICKIYVKFINLLLLTVRKNEQVMIAYNPQSIYAAGKMLNLLLVKQFNAKRFNMWVIQISAHFRLLKCFIWLIMVSFRNRQCYRRLLIFLSSVPFYEFHQLMANFQET